VPQAAEPDVRIRPLLVEDAAELAALFVRERAFLEPFDPVRGESWFTEAEQRARIERANAAGPDAAGRRYAILVGDAITGTIAVSNVVRGAFQSANIGYFVAQSWNGRGVASRAVALLVAQAFSDLELHRLEAGTLLDNIGSQRVLLRNGFRPMGMSRRYLCIAGGWRDHLLFARTREDDGEPVEGGSELVGSLVELLGAGMSQGSSTRLR
jgi:ribosomal-protein-alanine N-acetyltransferase